MMLDRMEGNAELKSSVQLMLAARRLTHSVLLVGEEGLGAGFAARCIAADYLYPAGGAPAEALLRGECCRAVGKPGDRDSGHVETGIVREAISVAGMGAGGKYLVSQVKAMRSEIFNTSLSAEGRAVLLYHVEKMNEESANALLKVMEEPPEGVLFLLTADSLAGVLPTIRSRCVSFAVAPVSPEQCARYCAAQGVDKKTAALYSELFDGHIGTVLAAAQDEARARRDALERAFLDAQAGLLAESLVEGAPCPVCGSTHHPARALLPHTAPTQAQVEAARQAAAEADRQAQNASAAAQSALATANEAKTSLRRDAETLLPERFTTPEGTVPLTFALMTNVLAEENTALQAAQTDCKAQCQQAEADCRRKAQLEADRQGKTRQRPALEQSASEADRSAAAQNASADALEGQIAERRAALPYPRRADAQAALDKLEADRSTLRTGMDTAQRKLKQAEQTVAAAEAAVEALTAQQTAAQKELPARSAEELTAQQTELTAARETLRSREKQLSAQLLPNRKTAAQYRAAAEARQTLESRWQWVSALAATAGGTLTSKQKIRLEAYIQMNYLDRILRYANTRLMQMTAGQYELERIGAENQRSQSGLDLGVIDHYNGTRRSVKTLSGGESFKASLALALGLSDEVQSSAGGIRLDTLFLDEGFGSLDEESLELAIRVLSGLTEGDRLVGIISHVGALKDRIDRQVVVHKARTGGSTVELRV